MVSVKLEIPDEVHSQLLGEALSLGLDLDEFLVARLLPPDLANGKALSAGDGEGDSEDPFEDIQGAYHEVLRILHHRMLEVQFNVLDLQRQAVQQSLEKVLEVGLTGAHHFYIAFRTDAPGVELGDDLRASHPETMTVVLENQFSSLEVDDEGFSVSLWFGGVPRRIGVPYNALVAFFDPSNQFQMSFPNLQIEAEDEGDEELEDDSTESHPAAAPMAMAPEPQAVAKEPDSVEGPAASKGEKKTGKATKGRTKRGAKSEDEKSPPDDPTPDGPAPSNPAPSDPAPSGNVISFANFRKSDGRKPDSRKK